MRTESEVLCMLAAAAGKASGPEESRFLAVGAMEALSWVLGHTNDLLTGERRAESFPTPAVGASSAALAEPDPREAPDDLDHLIAEELKDPEFARARQPQELRGWMAAYELGQAEGIAKGRRQAAAAVRAADTSGWPGGRQGDVDDCQEIAAKLAETGGSDG